jgi:SIR2-like domain
MSTHPDQDWLERSNAQTLYHLERQGRTSPGLVPFVGAGISTAFGFKDWKNLLRGAAPPPLVRSIEKQLSSNHYEEAAETLLKELGADGFQNMVAASAGDSGLEPSSLRIGTVSLLPLIASGPVITTNFDRVLERAFEASGVPFESVISGPRPDLIVDALHGNRRVLIKLHGDWQDRVGRTFAKSDYDANYGTAQPEQKRVLLAAVENLLFSSRSLLFIGASLGPDRTVRLLQEVHQSYAGIRHFAIMAVPRNKGAFEEKEKHLRSCGVLPLWYHADSPDKHAPQVERLVGKIVERISIQTLAAPVAEKHEASPSRKVPRVKPMPGPNAHFDRVVRLVKDGRLTFFLGSAIHLPTKLMAREFYEELARIFECEALRVDGSVDRFAVAQYIADRHGRDNLYAEIRKLFERTPRPPRATHELFASWREFCTDGGKSVPFPMVVTTNYDDLLECCLADASLPYHLLSYQADGPHRGLFYHRPPDNGLHVIERPHNIRRFSDAFVVVKLNGGFDRQRRIPESYSTTRLDYWDLAARIPGVLPAAIQEKLAANPLLFLGHGLAAPDIESLVRFAHKDHPGPRSWAVALKSDAIEYWRQCGVEILSKDVNVYVRELHDRLTGNGPTSVASEVPSDGAHRQANRNGKVRSRRRSNPNPLS